MARKREEIIDMSANERGGGVTRLIKYDGGRLIRESDILRVQCPV